MANSRAWRTLLILGLAMGLVAMAMTLGAGGATTGRRSPSRSKDPTATKDPATKTPMPPAFTMASCALDTAAKAPRELGNPDARRAAQRGIGFLEREAVAWQKQNNCYGCHVQAVTIEALSIGFHHQYEIDKKAFDEILRGMLDLPGGAHTPQGLYHSSPSIGDTAKVLGAAAFARHDQYVGGRVGEELLVEAKAILARQQTGGEVTLPFVSPPVATGTVQGTASAIITWKRAYERSADDQWLTAIQRAEQALERSIEGWGGKAPDLQSLDFAVMGLVAAGVGMQEDLMLGLAKQLRELQQEDGGWALAAGQETSPFATGQALYTLRLLGMTDRDPAIARGTKWLIGHQAESGGWSAAGFGKAEAMWAVLGLVSIDVLSIHVAGLQDGQHVDGARVISIEAKDNQGGGVVKVELELDDLLVAGSCGAALSWTWPAELLGTGRRVIDVRATNARGEVSRRRLEVFAGDTYLTQVGSRFVGNATELSLRDITEAGVEHKVAFEIYAAGSNGQADLQKRLWSRTDSGAQGPMRFTWDGRSASGAAQPAGKYVARLVYKDASGAVRQTEELPFVHDTAEKQWENYGQIQGAVSLPGGAAAGNAEIQLLDENDKVVGTTRSTGAGNYRFRNVDSGKKYKIVVRKDGFEAAPVAAAPAKAGDGGETKADIAVKKKR